MAQNHWNIAMRQAALKMGLFLGAASYSFFGGANEQDSVVYHRPCGEEVAIPTDDLYKRLGVAEFQNNITANAGVDLGLKHNPQRL